MFVWGFFVSCMNKSHSKSSSGPVKIEEYTTLADRVKLVVIPVLLSVHPYFLLAVVYLRFPFSHTSSHSSLYLSSTHPSSLVSRV